ncbi:MAG: rod shape-determining protein MreD, partial [Actinomycetota bacterium]|nr:rod shape-determining protein MreD [Actinomycetota bacterium]
AGLALDLAPPADTTVGRWALVLSLVGYAAGLVRADPERSVVVPLLVATGAATAAMLLFAGVGALLGDPRVRWPLVADLLPTAVLYALVLSPFVVPGVLAIARRLGPDPSYS